MSNSINYSTFICREALRGLFTKSKFIKSLSTAYSKYFGNYIGDGKKAGPTIYVPKPMLGSVREDWNMDVGDLTELTTPVTIDTVRGVDLAFTEADLFHTVDEGADFSKNIIQPNVSMLASKIDAYCANYVKNHIFNVVPVTSLGTAPGALSYFLSAGQMIKEQLVPDDSPLNLIISPRTEAAMVATLSGQYNPAQSISDMYEKGQMTKAAGFDWYMSQNAPAHTHGTCTTGDSPAVSAYATNTLTISGVTDGGTLKAGDSFYLDTNCCPVNFETKDAYASGQRFVVTADTTASGTNITVTVKPDIYISGPNQTVSATPVGAAVTFHQTTSGQVVQNDIILHRDSFALCFANLYKPKGMEMADVITKNGVTVRYVRGWDINTSQQKSRLDVFFGIRPLRPEWSARIIS
jgi:hypothetical protein